MTADLELSSEAVDRLADDCILASKALHDTGTFETGQAILGEAAAALRALRAERDAAWHAGAEAMRKAAANVASNACLVPPDGGNPTEEERLVCEEAWRRIRALPLPGQPKDGESAR